MASSREKKRGGLAVIAACVCALLVSLAVAVAPAAAEEGNSAPLRPVSQGGLNIPVITGPTAPEEYPVQYENLLSGVRFRQVTDRLIAVEYFGRETTGKIEAVPAYAADGTAVATSVRLSENEKGYVVTMIVHHRAGNPAAGGAPYVYPIQGSAQTGGSFAAAVEVKPTPAAAEPTAPAPSPPCKVPALRGLSLKAAKARLRAAHFTLGTVRLEAPTTARNGKVVKQFRAAGTQLPANAHVSVKLVAPGAP